MNVEFYPETDMQRAVGDVEAAVNALTTLPKESERPIISQKLFSNRLHRSLSPGRLKNALACLRKADTRRLAGAGYRQDQSGRLSRRGNMDRGPCRPAAPLRFDAGRNCRARCRLSLDVPGGVLRGDVERQVRAVGLALTAEEVGAISLRNASDGRQLSVSDVARVTDTFDASQPEGWDGDDRAIRLTVMRTKNGDAIEITETARNYLAEVIKSLPPTLKVQLFDVNADKIVQRINVLLFNGLTGMILVLAILFLFLNGRIAFWVAVGIPASLMATFGVMFYLDMTINMLSLFALIMTIGIIVDDAIVVGEHSATLIERGETALAAAEGGAIRMTMPITAAALTTLAAFIPILTIGGVMGQFVRDIPLVLLSVLVASLIECFLVLPGHLSHALSRPTKEPAPWRKKFFDDFDRFRDTKFRAFVARAYDQRYTTGAIGLAVLIIVIGLLAGGRVPFRFFPSPEGEVINAYVFFQPGTKRAATKQGTQRIEAALYAAEKELAPEGEKLVSVVFTQIGRTRSIFGDERALITAELTPSEDRDIRTREIVSAWEKSMPDIAGLRYVFVREQRGGPPGRDIDIRLQNGEPEILKQAAGSASGARAISRHFARARRFVLHQAGALIARQRARPGARFHQSDYRIDGAGNLGRRYCQAFCARR